MRWLAGLAAVAATALGLAVWLGWWGAALFHEMDEFYRGSTGTVVHPDDVYRYYDSLSVASAAMQAVLTPLLMGSILAVLGLAAVLALRWERREEAR